MIRKGILNVFAVVVPMLAVACGGGSGMMTGPSGTSGAGMMLLSVTPSGGATSVAANSTMVLRFSGPMSSGMEPFVDLHQGSLDGPLVAMSCGFSADRATLTCTPGAPLSPRTTYTLHVGGGMRDSAGRVIDMGQYGGAMGGQWIMGGMMGPSHAGAPWGMMGADRRGTNGSYGMAFQFTTG
jgi:hypothetical protein